MSQIRRFNPSRYNHKDKQPVAHVEGYNVYYFYRNTYWWWGEERITLSGELVDKNNVYVYGNRAKLDKQQIVSFVEEHLDGLIEEDLINRGIKTVPAVKSKIEIGSFSYANPRADIADENWVRQVKHKTKSSRIERTYSTPYYGEMPQNVIGMRGVSSGRLITIERREDYGLRDRN